MATITTTLSNALLILFTFLPLILANSEPDLEPEPEPETPESEEPESKVFQYDSTNFEKEIAEKNTFVMFFAPWCGHCKRLAPTWEELGEKYNTLEEKVVVVAKVDCTAETVLCAEQGVTGYPTLKIFLVGKPEGIRYKGSRDIASFDKFIKAQLGLTDETKRKPPVPIHSLVELTDSTFINHVKHGRHFVKFFVPWCGHCQRLAPTWEALAKSFEHDRSVTIAKIDCVAYKPICNEYEVKGYPTLLWIENGRVIEKYHGGRTHEELKKYVNSRKAKLSEEYQSESLKIPEEPAAPVIILTKENFKESIASGVTFVKFFAPWCSHCQRLAPAWEDLARKFVSHDTVKIAKVDCAGEGGRVLCKDEEIDGYPTMILYKNANRIQEYNGARDLPALYSFVMNHLRHDEF